MIKEMKPLSMIEARKIAGSTDLDSFFKKFVKGKTETAEKIRQEIEKLNDMKIKPEHIAKIIDIMPEDATDLNKIFADISLDENETNSILGIVKRNK